MNSQARKFFTALEIKENALTYVMALPLALYIAVICGDLRGDKLMAIFYGILISAGPVLFGGVTYNYLRLKRPLSLAFDETAGEEDLKWAHEKLLRDPAMQALNLTIRWIISPTLAVLIGHLFVPMEPLQYYAIGIVLLVIVPPGYVYSYFLTEGEFARVLNSPRMAALNCETSTRFSLRMKIALSLFTMGFSPGMAFGFIILEMNHNMVKFEHIGLHVIVIGFLLLVNLIYIAHLFSSSVRRTFENTRTGINRIVGGDLNTAIPVITVDEMGSMNNYLNNLVLVLNKIMTGIEFESKNLNSDSRNLADTITRLSDSTQDVASSVEEMSASIEELAASSESIADNSKEQNQQTTMVSSLMEKIVSNAGTIAGSAASGAQISRETEQKAGEGEIILNDTIAKIENIQRSTQSIHDSASLIKDIADQVNLLSLNASIEAARAGEYGRGFSVVAEEISKLADNTQKNADEITKSITTTLSDVNTGIASIRTTSEKFNEIISFVKKTATIVAEIAQEARSQTTISEEIQKHFSDMMNMAVANLRAAEEQATTHQEFIDTVARISEAIQDIAGKATSVNELSRVLDERADTLAGEIEFFSLK